MSVSPINENEYGAAFDYIMENAKVAKESVTEKLSKATPRSPLVNRLDNAQKRRDSHLNEKKEKAAVDPEKIKKQKEQIEEEMKEKTLNVHTIRVKSADSKRKSLLDEKKAKAQADVSKAKKLASQKQVAEKKQTRELKSEIEQRQAKALLAHAAQLEAVKTKAKVDEKVEKVLKVKKVLEKDVQEKAAVELERKLSAVELNREKRLEEEKTRLKEKHEKAKLVAQNKPKE